MERDCLPAVPKPRKRRTQSNVGESEGIPLLEFAGPGADAGGGAGVVGPTASPQAPAPRFDPPSTTQPEYQADKGALLSRHDISHVDSKSFVALFSRGLGNIAVSIRVRTT